jgi:hypothetical protein
MNTLLDLKKLKLIVIISLFSFVGLSQKQINLIDQNIYNDKLSVINLDSLIQNVKTVAIVSKSSCIGCVEYLLNENICENYIFILENLSITEMNSIKFRTNKNNCHYYFVQSNFQNNLLLKSDKSPVLINSNQNRLTFYDYNDLSNLTKSFTNKGRKIKKQLCK